MWVDAENTSKGLYVCSTYSSQISLHLTKYLTKSEICFKHFLNIYEFFDIRYTKLIMFPGFGLVGYESNLNTLKYDLLRLELDWKVMNLRAYKEKWANFTKSFNKCLKHFQHFFAQLIEFYWDTMTHKEHQREDPKENDGNRPSNAYALSYAPFVARTHQRDACECVKKSPEHTNI